jgi:hypothetical protein
LVICRIRRGGRKTKTQRERERERRRRSRRNSDEAVGTFAWMQLQKEKPPKEDWGEPGMK